MSRRNRRSLPCRKLVGWAAERLERRRREVLRQLRALERARRIRVGESLLQVHEDPGRVA